MNKFLLKLSGYYTTFEKTEQALAQANADNELLRNEISRVRKENSNTNLAYEHQLQLFARAEKEIASLKTDLLNTSKLKEEAEEKLAKLRNTIGEGIDTLEDIKKTISTLQEENENLRAIADKAEQFREARNRKRREKRARAKAEKQQENGEQGKA